MKTSIQNLQCNNDQSGNNTIRLIQPLQDISNVTLPSPVSCPYAPNGLMSKNTDEIEVNLVKKARKERRAIIKAKRSSHDHRVRAVQGNESQNTSHFGKDRLDCII
ncbi:hypothetical protein RJT34_10782 [Clitoria ternatea]|uniref:Uncharacterized protein n=1 Tax=Clitoria ternatea TaxID=43366 RepID=A0AAN9JKM9_CLITE